MRGRKPTPVAMRVLHGNPGRRPLRNARPGTALDTPDVPDFLDGEARAEWNRTLAEHEGTGLLTRADRALLAAYCVMWSRFVAAERHVTEHGPIVAAPRTATPMPNPHLKVSRDALDRLLKIAGELGLSPVSRARLHIAPAVDAPDGWEGLIPT